MESEATEMYLITIYRLTRKAAQASTTDIATLLGVSPPSVSERIKRLAEQGYLNHEWREGTTLTPKGEQVAINILRKHRLLETFLAQMAGYDIDEIHDEACKMEHAISNRLADRLEAMLNYPNVDPHGHPIPAQDGRVDALKYPLLAEADTNETVIIKQVSDWNLEQLRYLKELGLTPGAQVTIIDKAPFDGPLTLQVDNRIVALAPELAREIGVSALQ